LSTRRRRIAPVDTAAPRKIVCLETYWGDHNVRLFQNRSVLPFLEALSSLFDPPLRVAHRFVDTLQHLSHYTARPEGLLWRDAEAFDAPVFYLSFHGSPGTLRSSLERIGPEHLLKAFEGWGGSYANLVYFGACSVFAGREGRKFARDFLAASRCRAVLGYSTDVDWTDSMVTDLLFLQRFFRDADPWTNLKAIHASVLRDFGRARSLGYELYQPTPRSSRA
jgi:hypothetical protein